MTDCLICMICGFSLVELNLLQRQLHLNECLDVQTAIVQANCKENALSRVSSRRRRRRNKERKKEEKKTTKATIGSGHKTFAIKN